jgi:hypothetical protein
MRRRSADFAGKRVNKTLRAIVDRKTQRKPCNTTAALAEIGPT